MTQNFDVVVVGAGHAGCEAALAAHRLGAKVALITLKADKVAQMSCNPAIGGVGKGHLVREIDALGGAMARVADATGIQYRHLNTSRGPAVRSTRCQSDSAQYKAAMSAIIAAAANIELIEGEVVELCHPDGELKGLRCKDGRYFECRSCIITTGTFLNGLCHVGDEKFHGGRVGDAPASFLSDSLRKLGLSLGRFKTGTVPRLDAKTIRWDELDIQRGDSPRPRFSFDSINNSLEQIPCHITHTNAQTKAIVEENLHRSPLYGGIIEGTGPRYCPSFEDKVVRFAEKLQHHIFLEPEGLNTDRVYPNGLSTSLPKDVQDKFIATIPGLETAKILQYGYAVEYDYSPPTQLSAALMTKALPGLFLAGQINGTSGYEEAAAQGLMAGLNAVRYAGGEEPFVLMRHQGYIGVMIDDLVTKGVDEPYRVFTSRAEHRLTLRESNAEERLFPIAASLGLLSGTRLESAMARKDERDRLRRCLQTETVSRKQSRTLGLNDETSVGQKMSQILRRPDVSIEALLENPEAYSEDARRYLKEEIQYEGYISREQKEIRKQRELEDMVLPQSVDYHGASGLSGEIQEKLNAVKPKTLGQASRIPGMTPAAVALLRVQAHRWAHEQAA